LLAAQLVGWFFARLKQPVVIGEVLSGLLVGPALLGLVHDGEILEFLAELGAIFLLFMVGLETRLRDILAVGKEAFLVAVLGVLFPFVGGIFLALASALPSFRRCFWVRRWWRPAWALPPGCSWSWACFRAITAVSSWARR
jgi:Kef-type K+ transport system membrane component KefB